MRDNPSVFIHSKFCVLSSVRHYWVYYKYSSKPESSCSHMASILKGKTGNELIR